MLKSIALAIFAALTLPLFAAENFTPPASPRAVFNFNPGWKFIREDVTKWMSQTCCSRRRAVTRRDYEH